MMKDKIKKIKILNILKIFNKKDNKQQIEHNLIIYLLKSKRACYKNKTQNYNKKKINKTQ